MGGWIHKPLGEMGAALRAGKLSALELLEECAAAHRRSDEILNAYRVWNEAHAREQAGAADAAFRDGRDAGPLQGIPVSAKDLFGIAHLNTFAGSPKALPEKWSEEGPFVRAVFGQGAVLTGKTHQVEFAFGGLGTNAHWPIPRNPWDANDPRVSGGSSSGAGVSLMEGSCLVALGSDTAGSVRVPASMTGAVGLKVTAGRWPLDGIVPLSPTLDTPGVLCRSVADAALVFASIDTRCGKNASKNPIEAADLKRMRIGLCERHFWEECPDDIARVARGALKELETAGAELVSVDVPETEEAYELFKQGSVVSSELMAFLKSELPEWIETLDANIVYRISGALDLDSEEIAHRRERLREISMSVHRQLAGISVLASPTVPITAPKLSDVADVKSYSAANGKALRNTCIANIASLCAITMPVGVDGFGIPVGLQLMAPGNEEEQLLSVALAAEHCLGNPQERLGPPPLGA
jgi:aspartyl-tRNA(Asn)/glutamyl-tRNA(Gln) amidotransferase subunit A